MKEHYSSSLQHFSKCSTCTSSNIIGVTFGIVCCHIQTKIKLSFLTVSIFSDKGMVYKEKPQIQIVGYSARSLMVWAMYSGWYFRVTCEN